MNQLIKVGLIFGIVIALLLTVFAPAVINLSSNDESGTDELMAGSDRQGEKGGVDDDVNENSANEIDLDDIKNFYGYVNMLVTSSLDLSEDSTIGTQTGEVDNGHSEDSNSQSPGYGHNGVKDEYGFADSSVDGNDRTDEIDLVEGSSDKPDDDIIYSSAITVDDDGHGDYTSIQAAINAASHNDTIYVWGGVYYEDVRVNKSVKLIGNGTSATFVIGSASTSVMIVTEDWVQMTGFRLNGTGTYFSDSGIVIAGADNVKIDNCDVSNNNNGIYIVNSTSVKITNSTCSSTSRYGMYFVHTSDSHIRANRCNNNVFAGIKFIGQCHNNMVEDNEFLDNNNGIFTYGSNNLFRRNNCSGNNEAGIQARNLSHKIVDNMLFFNTYGVELLMAENILVDDNVCNNNDYGIYVLISDGNTIANNSCLNNKNGTSISSSSNNTIHSNDFSSNNFKGIDVQYSDYGDYIHSNLCNDNFIGIRIYRSSYEMILNNSCSNNYRDGIYLSNSNNNSVLTNYCTNNDMNGITVNYKSGNTLRENYCHSNWLAGIYLGWSNANTIEKNTCNFNSNEGICLWISNSNTVVDNNIQNNWRGLYVVNSYSNILHHNRVLDNTNQLNNITSTNTWDDGAGEGNWWSDYTGADDGSGGRTAGDGVGDTMLPHQGVDYYPLMIEPVNTTEAEEDIEDLMDEIETLTLDHGLENSLTKKLENAKESLEKGNIEAAINKLKAFINEVEAQRGKKIPESEADALIAEAQAIIDYLESL